MSKIIHVEQKEVVKILELFTGDEEADEFIDQLNCTLDLIMQISRAVPKNPIDEVLRVAVASQIFAMALFIQRNFDIVKDLVKSLDYKILDQDQKDGSLRFPDFYQ